MSVTTMNRLRLAAILAAGICAGSAHARARTVAPATGTFNKMYFVNSAGRVGYHMSTGLHVDDSDTPTGNVATCDPRAGKASLKGTIPPGLADTGDDAFEGTPRQPGDWYVNITYGGVRCNSGPDQADYGPKTVEVHFHIDP